MESKLKAAAMDSVGELPAGYPHLPATPIKQEPDAWNDASINPNECKVYETKTGKGEVEAYQFWTGDYWGMACGTIQQAIDYKHYKENTLKTRQWREVQE